MEFKRSVLKIDVYGEKVEITFPTVKQYREFDKKVKAKKKPEFELTVELLEILGMKKGLADEMEPIHLTKIVNALTGIDEKK